jgi:hypothetical protein
MFGSKKAAAIFAEQESRNKDYQQEYEYKVISETINKRIDYIINEEAAKGWELVTGCVDFFTHTAYMRRRLIP